MIKRAIIITLILNSLILIGVPAGHGYGIMIMFEFISISSLIGKGINFSENYPFNSLVLLGLISLLGKVALMISLFCKKISDKKILIYSGLGLLLSAFIGVVLGAWNYDNFLLAVTFGSGIPFLMYFGRVIYLMNRKASIPEFKADYKACVQHIKQCSNLSQIKTSCFFATPDCPTDNKARQLL